RNCPEEVTSNSIPATKAAPNEVLETGPVLPFPLTPKAENWATALPDPLLVDWPRLLQGHHRSGCACPGQHLDRDSGVEVAALRPANRYVSASARGGDDVSGISAASGSPSVSAPDPEGSCRDGIPAGPVGHKRYDQGLTGNGSYGD